MSRQGFRETVCLANLVLDRVVVWNMDVVQTAHPSKRSQKVSDGRKIASAQSHRISTKPTGPMRLATGIQSRSNSV